MAEKLNICGAVFDVGSCEHMNGALMYELTLVKYQGARPTILQLLKAMDDNGYGWGRYLSAEHLILKIAY